MFFSYYIINKMTSVLISGCRPQTFVVSTIAGSSTLDTQNNVLDMAADNTNVVASLGGNNNQIMYSNGYTGGVVKFPQQTTSTSVGSQFKNYASFFVNNDAVAKNIAVGVVGGTTPNAATSVATNHVARFDSIFEENPSDRTQEAVKVVQTTLLGR